MKVFLGGNLHCEYKTSYDRVYYVLSMEDKNSITPVIEITITEKQMEALQEFTSMKKGLIDVFK
jgi:hypothetical protein